MIICGIISLERSKGVWLHIPEEMRFLVWSVLAQYVKSFFIVPPLNVYKRTVRNKLIHYCSYSCLNKAKKTDGRKTTQVQHEKLLEKLESCAKIAEGGAVE